MQFEVNLRPLTIIDEDSGEQKTITVLRDFKYIVEDIKENERLSIEDVLGEKIFKALR